jgi:hypothetical protein
MARVATQPQGSTAQLETLPNGGAAAALLAAGIGCVVLGVLSILTNVFDSLSNALKFYGLADDISGVSTLMVVVWLLSWLILHQLWKKRQVNFPWVFVFTLILIALGLLGTFPLFDKVFGGG